MAGYERLLFDSFLVNNGVVEFRKKKVKLSSGRYSNFYINVRNLMDDVVTLDELMLYVNVWYKHLKPDYFLGVAEGMTRLGLIMNYTKAKEDLPRYKDYFPKGYPKKYPLPMARGRIKKYGNKKDRYFLGSLKGKVVVLEDVLTTGDSTMKLIKNLRENGADVLAVIGVVDRLELRKDGLSVAEKFSKLGVDYYSMTDVKTLLPLAYEKLKPSEGLVKKINRYYKKYGSEEIRINI